MDKLSKSCSEICDLLKILVDLPKQLSYEKMIEKRLLFTISKKTYQTKTEIKLF